jgi:hypothetical protein
LSLPERVAKALSEWSVRDLDLARVAAVSGRLGAKEQASVMDVRDDGRRAKMSGFAWPFGQTTALSEIPAPVERQAPSARKVLPVETLEHGAYYAGALGGLPVVARWHSGRRRFVFGEFALGRQRVRSVPHVLESGTGDRFAPWTKAEPASASRISDYAFETAG